MRTPAHGRKTKRTRSRRATALGTLALLITLAAGASLILGAIPVSGVDVIIRIVATELDFILEADQPLTRALEARSIDLYELSAARIPTAADAGLKPVPTTELHVRMSDARGTLGIGALVATRRTNVTVRPRVPRHLAIALQADHVEGPIVLTPTGRSIVSTARDTNTLNYPEGTQVTGFRETPLLSAHATFPDTLTSWFASRMLISGFTFARTEVSGGGDPSLTKSLLDTLAVTLRDYDGYRIDVGHSQIVNVDIASPGELLDLRVTPRGVEGTFAGTLAAMTVAGNDVMPTRLDFFAKHSGVKLRYSAGVFILGGLLWLYKWQRQPE